jgi:aromatase
MSTTASTPQTSRTAAGLTTMEHTIGIGRSALDVYRLLAEVANWPRLFPPTVHLEREDLGRGDERIHVWATANGAVKSWTSVRKLDEGSRTISFRQVRSTPPVASMGGTWIVEEAADDSTCVVRLLHDFAAVDDEPADLDWIIDAVDTNSRSELAALKRNAEASDERTGLLLEFEDTVQVAGPARACFDFVNDAGAWTQRLGHVSQVRLDELGSGVQTLEMDTIAKDGSVHTTKSYRICFEHDRIVYKQTTLPPLMTVHNGEWTFLNDGAGGARITSRHVVVLNPDTITQILGDKATVDTARTYVQQALSTNSLLTLNRAKAWAEGAGR